MALRHRRCLPQPARELYQRALNIDPGLWRHPETRRELRIVRQAQTGSVPANPSLDLPPIG